MGIMHVGTVEHYVNISTVLGIWHVLLFRDAKKAVVSFYLNMKKINKMQVTG